MLEGKVVSMLEQRVPIFKEACLKPPALKMPFLSQQPQFRGSRLHLSKDVEVSCCRGDVQTPLPVVTGPTPGSQTPPPPLVCLLP